MNSKILFRIILFFSVFMLISFTAYAVKDFLTVGTSYFWFFIYYCPFIYAILFVVLSLRLASKTLQRVRYIPLVINGLTVTVTISLLFLNHINPDYGFLRHYEGYSAVAHLIESGDISINSEGFAQVPDDLSHTSRTGYVFVTKEMGVNTIFFLVDAENFDGYSWGYLYRSDGSKPQFDIASEIQNPRSCTMWRAIIPPTANWFYCEIHLKWVFPEK